MGFWQGKNFGYLGYLLGSPGLWGPKKIKTRLLRYCHLREKWQSLDLILQFYILNFQFCQSYIGTNQNKMNHIPKFNSECIDFSFWGFVCHNLPLWQKFDFKIQVFNVNFKIVSYYLSLTSFLYPKIIILCIKWSHKKLSNHLWLNCYLLHIQDLLSVHLTEFLHGRFQRKTTHCAYMKICLHRCWFETHN